MSNLFSRALSEIEHNKSVVESGGVVSIPFIHLPRMMRFIPGIQKKNYMLVTASSGVGKSQFTKRSYIIEPILFLWNNPHLNIKLKIFVNLMEENQITFANSVMSNWLYRNRHLRLSVKDLLSYYGPVDDTALHMINSVEAQEFFTFFREKVEIVSTRSPYGFYKTVEEYCLTQGEWVMKEKEIAGEKIQVRDYFKYHNDDQYVIAVSDHTSLYEQKGLTLHQAMDDWSSKYAMSLRDDYFCSVVDVQQQEAAKEKQQYTYKGESIEQKMEPSLDGLADNKKTQRNVDEAVGLFAPDRYNIENHRGYNIDLLRDNYRSLRILKSRYGEANKYTGLFYDGATLHFEQLPKPADMDIPVYNSLLERAGRLPTFNIIE